MILLALAALALPFVVVWLAVAVARLTRRVARLEAQLLGVPAPTAAAAPVTPSPWSTPPDAARAREAVPVAAPAVPPEAVPPSEPAEVAVASPPPAVPARDWIGGLAGWLRGNWIYAVSALSLGLAGVFLVQYGAEHGLLGPGARILLALGLGAALLVAGEAIRRRWGDTGGTSTAALPSTFSGAGIVVLYVAILAARGLYGLVGPEVAFAGLLGVSILALVFGWFYGPFLAAAGLTGGAIAPFLVGGEAGGPGLLFLYFGLLGGAGLAIDAMRCWGWVSTLALALAFGGGSLARGALGGQEGYVAFLLWLALAAVAVPRLELWPSHPGPSLLEKLLSPKGAASPRPVAPTWIALGAVAASSLLIFLSMLEQDPAGQLLSLGALALLAAGLILWTERAEGLVDLPLVPALLLLAFIPQGATRWFGLYAEFQGWDAGVNPEASPPWTVSLILGAALVVTLAAWWRSLRGPWGVLWALVAALVAPVATALLEFLWQPARVMGPWPWALHAVALAGVMTAFASRYAARDGEDRRRAAYAALSAMSLIALAVFVLLSDAALTVAFAVLVAVAAALDRRFRLPEMGWFILAGVAALGWRLTVYPGVMSYLFGEAPLAEVVLAYGAGLLGLAGARALLPIERVRVRAALESAFLAYAGVFASVLLGRFVDRFAPGADLVNHWSVALLGLIWTGLALAQAQRARLGGPLARVRLALAGIEGALGGVAFVAVLTGLNPFFNAWEVVRGSQPFDTLLVAYLLPALALGALAWRLDRLRGRVVLVVAGGVFGATWAFLAIRRFWQGDVLAVSGFTQPELYSYTVALLSLGGVLLAQALRTRSAMLRRLAMAVIALTIAKVFLVDAAGLAGLLRVFSFLALGLVLAGLAWLNRWASGPPEEGRA
ncbi:hypothetical protein Rumeso_03537 [Rubellimicrobium mesophilum DSM 19309]|uniref:Uncharacterized protein n=1 Tax=Rubellimicrobium mesophilum DSM 19309 TaxID=442562 RepID=A0A017HKL7_9RHOB|nr:DUF2339 domain-containing protein [Rubellimicrobium mesophilum]EYD74896.1 hypothetical protein Rumeso_03537 [Rubellimicrobium mesophilum DSM 19309]